MNTRTIIASASAAGRGGVSIVRMSGEGSRSIAEKMCGVLSEPWKFKKCSISSQNGEVIDSGMVVFFQPPHSYTCLLYTSPSPRDYAASRMPSSA